MKRTILIDGHNYLFRYFQGMPSTIMSSRGQPIHAAYGMIAAVLRAVHQFTPNTLLVVFDAQGPSERTELFSAYKGNRLSSSQEEANSPFAQLGIVRDALHYLAIPWVEQPGIEADDLIGSYAMAANNQEVIILSTDKDYLQLVNNTIKLYIRRGKTETWFTPELVQETFGITPAQYIEFKTLTGDKSDNIPGIAGIGAKTAAHLLRQYGTLDNLYHHLLELTPRLRTTLETHRDLVTRNKNLITIQTTLPVDRQLFDAFSPQKLAGVTVREVFTQLGLFEPKHTPPSSAPFVQHALIL